MACGKYTLGTFAGSKVTMPSVVTTKETMSAVSRTFSGFNDTSLSKTPIPSDCPVLEKPIVIPQSASGMGGPFSRAYAEDLRHYGISEEAFVEIIDLLNIVMSPSPLLELLEICGDVMTEMPAPGVQIAGPIIQVAAIAAKFSLLKVRLIKFVQTVDIKVFKPRGLKLKLLSSKDLANWFDFEHVQDLVAPLLPEHMNLSVYERRMTSIQGFVAPLKYSDLPTPKKRASVLKKIASSHVKQSIKETEKQLLKGRDKHAQKQEWYDPLTMDVPLVKTGNPKKDHKLERKRTQTLQKRATKLRRNSDFDDGSTLASNDSFTDRLLLKRRRSSAWSTSSSSSSSTLSSRRDRKVAKRDAEQRAVKRLLWLVIDNRPTTTTTY